MCSYSTALHGTVQYLGATVTVKVPCPLARPTPRHSALVLPLPSSMGERVGYPENPPTFRRKSDAYLRPSCHGVHGLTGDQEAKQVLLYRTVSTVSRWLGCQAFMRSAFLKIPQVERCLISAACGTHGTARYCTISFVLSVTRSLLSCISNACKRSGSIVPGPLATCHTY